MVIAGIANAHKMLPPSLNRAYINHGIRGWDEFKQGI